MGQIEKRKKKLKPRKLFTVVANVYDDGILAGYGIEYRNMGRLKNQKMVVPGKEDFITCVRSIVPSAIPTIEKVVNAVYEDADVEESEGSEKIAKVTIDIYSDSFIDSDFSELNKGPRGAPRAWRLSPNEFINNIKNRLGDLSENFRPLLTSGSTPEVLMEDKEDEEDGDDE